tara:strand:- start:182 stop:715 length:534 start_codon:yes stop_codon:yes gene_type:complete
MLNLKLTDEIRQYANKQINTKDFGRRFAGFNGTREQQYTGIVGECMIYKALGKDLPTYDGGFSIVDLKLNDKKIDIKTMTRTVDMRDFYVHNFVGYQKDTDNDIILAISINKKTGNVQVCGWLPKEEFLKKASFFDKGTVRERSNGTSFRTGAPLYELENNKLNPINDIQDLKNIGA